jgi:hypothetical protein
VSDVFLIVKRGLYFRPNCQGYTGIRDEAGRYSEETARYHAENGDSTIVHVDEVPEFMPAGHSDLIIVHLKKQRDALVIALKAIIDANHEFLNSLPEDWEGDPLQDACFEAAKLLTGDVGGPAK